MSCLSCHAFRVGRGKGAEKGEETIASNSPPLLPPPAGKDLCDTREDHETTTSAERSEEAWCFIALSSTLEQSILTFLQKLQR